MSTTEKQNNYTATPVAFTAAELAEVTYNADGLVPAIVQDASDQCRAHVRLDERGLAAEDAGDRAHLVLESQPPGVLVQG